MTGKETMQIPADTRLAEELAGDDVVEMANLTTAQTGVPGTIFISTAMGGLGAQTLLSEITAERVQTYFDCKRVTKLKSGKAKAKPSIDKTRRVLRLALVWAEEAGLVAKAPIPEGPVEAQA